MSVRELTYKITLFTSELQTIAYTMYGKINRRIDRLTARGYAIVDKGGNR